jgi:hypothetical protein
MHIPVTTGSGRIQCHGVRPSLTTVMYGGPKDWFPLRDGRLQCLRCQTLRYVTSSVTSRLLHHDRLGPCTNRIDSRRRNGHQVRLDHAHATTRLTHFVGPSQIARVLPVLQDHQGCVNLPTSSSRAHRYLGEIPSFKLLETEYSCVGVSYT